MPDKPNRLKTVFQNLDRTFNGNWKDPYGQPLVHSNTYNISNDDKVIYRSTNKQDYEKTKLELQQNKYLQNRWVKANVDLSVTAFAGLSNIKLMYRDADLMDSFPEIGAAPSYGWRNASDGWRNATSTSTSTSPTTDDGSQKSETSYGIV